MLEAGRAIGRLVELGLIGRRQVVAGGVTLEDVSRRNSNYRVVTESNASFLVKQASNRSTRLSLAREAAVLAHLHRRRGSGLLREGIPRLCHYGRTDHCLITRVDGPARSLHQHISLEARLPQWAMRRLGRILGELHRLPVPALTGGRPALEVARWQPSFEALFLPRIEARREYSQGNWELVAILQRTPEFPELVQNTCSQRSGEDCLIHGDVKGDNAVVRFAGGPRRRRLYLVDWEHASLGDPAWDVGSVFADCLAWWIYSLPIAHEVPTDAALRGSPFPLERVQRGIAAFWAGYSGSPPRAKPPCLALLRQATRLAAVRLLQTAFERTQNLAHLTGNTVCVLQASLNVLRNPDEAISQLVGLPLRASWQARRGRGRGQESRPTKRA